MPRKITLMRNRIARRSALVAAVSYAFQVLFGGLMFVMMGFVLAMIAAVGP